MRRGVTAGASLPEPQHDAQGACSRARHTSSEAGSSAPTTTSSPSTRQPTRWPRSAACRSLHPMPRSPCSQAPPTSSAATTASRRSTRSSPGAREDQPKLVARLPYGLRYAAVAASDGELLIVGGTHGEAATTTILSFDPATHELRHIGDLPEPVTHAAAVALGSYAYVLGGRGSASGTQSAAIFAVDAATGDLLSTDDCHSHCQTPPRSPSATGCGWRAG